MPYSRRAPQTNRTNPYLAPGGYDQLIEGLQFFGSYLCTSNRCPFPPSLSASTTSVTGTVLTIAQLLGSTTTRPPPRGPSCAAQSPLGYRPPANPEPSPIFNRFRELRPATTAAHVLKQQPRRRSRLRRIV